MPHLLLLALPLLAQAALTTTSSDLTLTPRGLQVECRVSNLSYDVDGIVRVTSAAGEELYTTSIYTIPYNNDNCREDARRISLLINAAIVTGKEISYRIGNSPKKDFSLANHDPLLVSPTTLEVGCEGGGPRLTVRSSGLAIYQTSEYTIPYTPEQCYSASDRLTNMFTSARAGGKLIEFQLGNSPKSDFGISNRGDPARSR